MASAAEQLAANISLSTFSKATELKKRLWFTLGALVLFRLLSFVPIPGIDPRALASLFQTQQGGVLDFFNTFSGGSLERMSIIALGVMPYITASIVVQLAGSLYEPWKQLKKEGETGRKKLNQYTRYLTVALTTVQGYFIAVGLEGLGATQGIAAVVEPGPLFRIAATISLVGGTLFLMWVGATLGSGIALRIRRFRGHKLTATFLAILMVPWTILMLATVFRLLDNHLVVAAALSPILLVAVPAVLARGSVLLIRTHHL